MQFAQAVPVTVGAEAAPQVITPVDAVVKHQVPAVADVHKGVVLAPVVTA